MSILRFWARCVAAALATSSLCSCGSDGGGGVTSNPVAPTYATLASGTGALSASGSLSNSSRAPNASIAATSAFAPDVSISYNSANQTYTLSAVTTLGSTQPVTASYGPAQVDSTLGTGAYNATTVANGVTTVSRLQVNLLPALTYSNIGEWVTGSTQADFTQNFNTILFSYGIRTLPSDMPKTGTANYGLSIVGDSNIGGTGTLNANFGTGTVSVSLSPQYVYPNGTSNLGPITGTGTISSGTSSFASAIASNAYIGSVNGAFYGPQAAEAGGSFIINSASNGGLIAVGAFGGKKN